ncbi:MAG: D-alanine--D-alanine ligase [Proteobacteria bacterium]|nr:D-alanine--D-alanine ligase [Pseudomonadota bacterium]
MTTTATAQKQSHAKKTIRKVAVLMGGWSSEREVSLVTGGAVCKALEDMGYEYRAIDVQRDTAGLLQALTMQSDGRPDVVFNALHGRVGEDGTVQGLLEFIGIPYTHSGVLASSIAMDKPLMKVVAKIAGVPSPEGRVVSRQEILDHGYPFPPPFVIKPTNEGSSVGVRVVMDDEDIKNIEEDGWIYGNKVLVEQFIPGKELTVAVLGETDGARALGVTELRPINHLFYDYTAKYSGGETEHLLPAPLPKNVYDEAMRLAVLAFEAVGCCGAARADFRWDDTKDGVSGLYFLELNTQPGMTPTSLLPEQAAFAGIPFNDLIRWMLEHPTCPA